jgi:hypothetical protein
MILDNILAIFIGFGITILLYIAINAYRWLKLKRHVIEAIEELNLWNTVNTCVPLPGDAFRSIITFLNYHNYEHCFNGQGGAFKLFYMLSEIRREHEQNNQ